MKIVPQRNANSYQQGTKMPEVTVIKHFQPNPTRETKGNLPEVKCFEHLPEGSRYLHLHPVFKFVDNFLSPENNKTRVYVNRKSCVRFSGNTKPTCCPTYAVSNACVRNLPPKKSRMPPCLASHRERIQTNLCNMSSSSNVRVSLRPPRCPPCAPEKPPDYYVEELKSEIKQNKPKIQELGTHDDAYVKKLKEELMVQKSRYLDDARNIINDLQNEIYNYRLQVKARFASSSETFGSDKTPRAPHVSPHRKQIADKITFDSPHSPGGTIGCKPCETLWRSKASFASSTDLDSSPGAADINFEEKLQEANFLIDKVRNALRDIGKGIHKVPEHKKPQIQRQPVKQAGELIHVFPKPIEEKKTPPTKEIQKQEPTFSESVVKKLVEEAKTKAIREERQKIIREEPIKKMIAPEPKKKESIIVVKPPTEVTKEGYRKTGVRKDERFSGSKHQVFIPRPTLVEDHFEKDSIRTDISQSMEILQTKLNAISEGSETDMAFKTETKKHEPQPPAKKIERASSPIKIKGQKKHLDSASGETPDGSSTSDVGCFLSIVMDRQSQMSSVGTPATPKPKSPTRKISTEKTSKLSIHVMPPVHIPRSLVMQKTLNLSIKPTGSVVNHMAKKRVNVGYEEVKVHLCPVDCKLEDVSCKHSPGTSRELVPCSRSVEKGSNIVYKEIMEHLCPIDCGLMDDGCQHPQGVITRESTQEELLSSGHPLQGMYEPSLYRRAGPSSHTTLTKSSDMLKQTPSGISRNPRPSGLTEDALILFRSFQILDEVPKGSQLSLSTITRKRAKSISDSERRYDRPERLPASDKSLDKKTPTYEHGRSPWDFGFYKTRSTQCSKTSLYNDIMSQKPSDSDDMPKSSSFDLSDRTPTSQFSPGSPTSQRSSLEEERVEISAPSVESISKLKRTLRSTTDLSERSGSRKSPPPISAAASLHPLEAPVKDNQSNTNGPVFNMNDILNLLNEHQAQDATSISQSIISPSEQGDFKTKKRPLPSPELKKSDSSSSTSSSERKKKKDSKKNSPSSSSSSSSYSNAGSPPRVSPPILKTSPNPSKRSRETSIARSKESSVQTVKSFKEGNGSVPVSKTDVNEKKTSEVIPPLEKVPDTDSVKGSVKSQGSVRKGKKTDRNIQVSLSPDESSTSSEEEPLEDSSTVACFIRGLTGTSEEQLNKLKSTASFPKSDPSTWSTVKLPTMKELQELNDLDEESKEKVVGSHEYTDTPESPDKPENFVNASNVSTLSDVTKMKRLQHFQKMAQNALHLEKKSHKDVFMSLVQPKGEAGEGVDRSLRAGRNLPFYRRVLGRILEPSRKIQTSQSDPTPNPLDESISEGEIKCRSASIGEIRPVRYALDRKKLSKGVMRYAKKCDDLGDKPWRIARQRTQYNQWVSYYLQKHHNVSCNDSTSTSPVSSKK
nr:PREDICTED: uncharacterized protein LOC103312701 [Tribolium castaneum]|eukprot:XP_008192291.1 PREDICTED: uncharacterized protein LOC103312701 [Tribolium castaneum]